MTTRQRQDLSTWPGRLLPLIGLVLAAAVGVWWLGSSRLALQQGADTTRAAGQALATAWLLRAMALSLLVPGVGQVHGLRAGLAPALALLAPCWPVVVLAWSAGTAALMATALAELALLAGAIAMCGLGAIGARWRPHSDLLPAAWQALGVVTVAALWAHRAVLTGWAGGGSP